MKHQVKPLVVRVPVMPMASQGARRLIAALLAAAWCSLVQAGPAWSQAPDSVVTSSFSVPAAVVGGTLGSAAGLVGGFFAGMPLGIGGGDDPGVEGALLFAGLGSMLGASLGVRLANGGSPPLLETLGLSASGIAAGLAGGWALNQLAGGTLDESGAVVGYAIGHGLFVGGMAGLLFGATR